MTARSSIGFRSLTDEIDHDCSVTGTLPDWLSGTLIRNGPGAFEMAGSSVDHWFDGLAMLHAFTFGDGVTYRNRFVHSDAYRSAREGNFESGFATGNTTLRDRLKAFFFEKPYDNANIIAERIGDDYLALTELPRWVAFDPDTLETLGHVQYDGPEPAGNLACAHLKRDPVTDELVNFETSFGRNCHYHVHSIPSATDREHICSIPVDEPAYMHSFALTPNYVVLTEFPFVVNPLDFIKPGSQGPFIENFTWKPERGTRFFVIDRRRGTVVAALRTEAFFGFHHANAYEDDGEIVLDLETVPDATAIEVLYLDNLRDGNFGGLSGRLERFRVDPESETVERERMYDGTALPTTSPDRWCRKHRYVYAQSPDPQMTTWPEAIAKIDTETHRAVEFADEGNYLGEPIFVPNPDGERVDDGVILTLSLDPATERSSLIVVDGESLAELARAEVPHPIPFDFHGRFFPELTG
ncbi:MULTISPECIES: carotenoid oxygenase family protein [unclassified Haladaptatus]|uniref:carotenoid oxygenase family protein n=1 Tax=unclassified Haladaptatus TaxID=2622732 RepID=UPI00209C3D35|nr:MULTISPECIES: carotenoid oxygenase family protein [unclassified Haladaptatus]MCO8246484.1 carotenoid oxygenase family protein [Haladaptatus sp. AB643]MCO8254721.1 carotenoid oxygenase family protein [Haladaptatus sp. AB618]